VALLGAGLGASERDVEDDDVVVEPGENSGELDNVEPVFSSGKLEEPDDTDVVADCALGIDT